MGQKAKKRKAKANVSPNATEMTSKTIHDTMDKSLAAMKKLAHLKEEENILKKEEMEFEEMQAIMSDTSTMNENQRQVHEKYCNKLKEKYEYFF